MPGAELHSYLYWLKERGVRYPVLRAVAPRPVSRVVFVAPAALTADERSLLDKMILAMKLSAERVLVTDPAGARALPDPAAMVILLGGSGPHGQVRQDEAYSCPVLTTTHPGDLLRTPAEKRAAWSDLQVAMAHLGLS